MQPKRKLKNRSGFTLAETLLAVLILLLVSGIVASGIPAAKNAYLKVIVGANAQALASTTVNALKDELTSAWDVQKCLDGSITYFSANTGARSKIFLESGSDGTSAVIKLQEYIGMGIALEGVTEGALDRHEARPLVSDKAKTSDLYVTYDSVSVDATDDTVTFTNLVSGKITGSTRTPLITLQKVTIPVLSTLPDEKANTEFITNPTNP